MSNSYFQPQIFFQIIYAMMVAVVVKRAGAGLGRPVVDILQLGLILVRFLSP